MSGNLIKMCEAVLFDFDGVIADSEPFFFESYSRAFARRGHKIDREEYWDYWTCRGEGVAGEIRRHNLPFDDKTAKEIFAERRTTYSEFCNAGTVPLYPGMMQAVETLVAGGKPCAIASNSFEDDIRAVLRHAGFDKPPCPVIGRLDGLRTKPAPDIFIYSAGLLRTAPASCLVVEDAQKGLDAARAAGMTCAIIRTPFNKGIGFPDADTVFDGHAFFVEAVSRWNS